jgi:putative glutamine amidotransferase
VTPRGLVVLATGAEPRARPYREALEAVGAPADRLRVVTPEMPGRWNELAADTAAVILCGGLDVAPGFYGETIHPEARVETDAGRDALEWEILGAARERRLPVWGICRGLQLLNVFLGGTLVQDLPSERPGPIEHSLAEPPDLLAHSVQAAPSATRLAEILGRGPARVNSRHHQAIERLAPGLVADAHAPDGVIEAVSLPEAADGWWVRGVQWHPENLLALPEQRALWRDFVAVASREAR